MKKVASVIYLFLLLFPLVSASSEGAGSFLGLLSLLLDFLIWVFLFWIVLAVVARLKGEKSPVKETRFWEISFFTFLLISLVASIFLPLYLYVSIIAILVFGFYRITVGGKFPPETRYNTHLFVAVACALIVFALWGVFSGFIEKRMEKGDNCESLPNVLTTPYFTSTGIVYYGRDARNKCFMEEAVRKRDPSICDKLGRTYAFSGNTKGVCLMNVKNCIEVNC